MKVQTGIKPDTIIKSVKKINSHYYSLTVYPNLLHIQAFSSWDETVADELLSQVYHIAGKYYAHQSWALLSDATAWQHSTPPVAARIAGAGSKEIRTPLKYHAMVSGGSELKKWQLHNMRKKGGNIDTRIFSTQKEAKAWLAEMGYLMPD